LHVITVIVRVRIEPSLLLLLLAISIIIKHTIAVVVVVVIHHIASSNRCALLERLLIWSRKWHIWVPNIVILRVVIEDTWVHCYQPISGLWCNYLWLINWINVKISLSWGCYFCCLGAKITQFDQNKDSFWIQNITFHYEFLYRISSQSVGRL